MGVATKVTETYEASFDSIWKAVQEFKPDILLPGLAFDLYTAHAIGQVLQIPVIYCPLSIQATLLPSAQVTTDMNEPCLHFQAALFGLKALQFMIYRKFAPIARMKLADQLQGAPLWMDSYKHGVDEIVKPSAVVLVQNSEHFKPCPSDFPACFVERSRQTGFWIVSKEQQLGLAGDSNGFIQNLMSRTQTERSHFGGSAWASVGKFLDESPEPPVYIGWGSMLAISAEHMVDLAVGALKESKKRGIIVGGWAKLNVGLLTDQSLVDYAAQAVLFVDSAPHEMLFPRCSVTIHHGGMGTTVAAMRSGKPTIVTPMIYDQFENSRMVQDSGAGIGMAAFKKATAKSLADAICKCTTDEVMKGKSRALGEALRAEDGLQNALSSIDTFVRDELDTGKWRASFEATLRRRSQPAMGRISWFCKMRSAAPFDHLSP